MVCFNILIAYSSTFLVSQSPLLWSLLSFLPKASATEYKSTRMDHLKDMKLENMNDYETAIHNNMKDIDNISFKTEGYHYQGVNVGLHPSMQALYKAFTSILPRPYTVFVQNKNQLSFWNYAARRFVIIEQVTGGKLCENEKDLWVEYEFEISKQLDETKKLFSEQKSDDLMTITASATTESEAGEDVGMAEGEPYEQALSNGTTDSGAVKNIGMAEVEPHKEVLGNEATDSDNNAHPTSYELQFASKIEIIVDNKGIGVIRLHYKRCFSLINQSIEKIRQEKFIDEMHVFYKSDMLYITINQEVGHDQNYQTNEANLSLERLANYCGNYEALVHNTYSEKVRSSMCFIANPNYTHEPVMKWILCETSSNILHLCKKNKRNVVKDLVTNIDDNFRDIIGNKFLFMSGFWKHNHSYEIFFSSLADKIEDYAMLDEYKNLSKNGRNNLTKIIEKCRIIPKKKGIFDFPSNVFARRSSYVLKFCAKSKNDLRIRNLVLTALIDHLENFDLKHDYLSLDEKRTILGFNNNKYPGKYNLKLSKKVKKTLNGLLMQIKDKEKNTLGPENTVKPADAGAETVPNTNPKNVLVMSTDLATDAIPEIAVEQNTETRTEPSKLKYAENRYEILKSIENLICIIALREKFYFGRKRPSHEECRESDFDKMLLIIKQMCELENVNNKDSAEWIKSKIVFLCRVAILESIMVKDDKKEDMQKSIIDGFNTVCHEISLVSGKCLLRQICNDDELKKIIIAQYDCLKRYTEDNFSTYYANNYIDNCEHIVNEVYRQKTLLGRPNGTRVHHINERKLINSYKNIDCDTTATYQQQRCFLSYEPYLGDSTPLSADFEAGCKTNVRIYFSLYFCVVTHFFFW